MATYEIFKKCSVCGGDGLHFNVTENNAWENTTCYECNGVGSYLFGTIDLGDLEDNVNNVLDKCNDIMDKLNE